MENEERANEKLSSIEVSRNGKGEYALKVKLYFNEEEKSNDEIVGRSKNIIESLKDKFNINEN